jgi:hypothetical protein
MDPTTRILFQGSANTSQNIYVEDVFSTWIYNGTGSTQSIVNSINLSGEGGLVWIKGRNFIGSNVLTDTVRGVTKQLITNSSGIEATVPNGLTAFNTNGFSIAGNSSYNASSNIYVSWTFRKSPKFFDVVSYTGTGVARTISHGLQSTPGLIIVKGTNLPANWYVYHRSLTNTEALLLESTNSKLTGQTVWNSTTPTSNEFSIGATSVVNGTGNTYIAYLFAHDPSNIIRCDSYTGTGVSGLEVTLDWEPQLILIKSSSSSGDWVLFDNIRGSSLLANSTNTESTSGPLIEFTSTGFKIISTASSYNSSGVTYAYVAIRRGPMRIPTDATQVFQPVVYTGTNLDNRLVSTGILTDMALVRQRNSTSVAGMVVGDRLRGNPYLLTGSVDAEVNDPDAFDYQLVTTEWGTAWSSMTGFWVGNDPTASMNVSLQANNHITHAFRRAPEFFDVVAYTGTGSARTVSHNLGVAPELMIVKRRNATADWAVVVSPNWNSIGTLQSDIQFLAQNDFDSTAPTSLVFSVSTALTTNGSGSTYIAYLFATCPGVSKVGSYTGTGTTKDIDCGFTAGARFVLIKRTDSTGDWYVWDSARDIVSGNDSYLLLNSTAAEVTNTDYIDPLSSGFQISSTAPAAINASGGSFIYLAIA